MKTQANNIRIKAYAIVRDRFGRIKVDDPSTIPPEIYNTLTDKDKEDIKHGFDSCHRAS